MRFHRCLTRRSSRPDVGYESHRVSSHRATWRVPEGAKRRSETVYLGSSKERATHSTFALVGCGERLLASAGVGQTDLVSGRRPGALTRPGWWHPAERRPERSRADPHRGRQRWSHRSRLRAVAAPVTAPRRMGRRRTGRLHSQCVHTAPGGLTTRMDLDHRSQAFALTRRIVRT